MEVRILDTDDAAIFRDLRIKGLLTDPTAFGSTYAREVHLPLEKFKNRLEHTSEQFTVGGFKRNQLVCTASFAREFGEKSKHKGTLAAMYCEEKYRGTGIAKEVVHYLLRNARKINDVEIINLTVVSENLRAKSFYEQFGFKKYGQEPKALFFENRYYDEDLMYLEI